MKFHSNSNKGMYIEELVNKTIAFYIDNKICFLEKRNLDIKIIKNDKNIIIGKLLSKSYVDYFGLVNQKFVSFEAKQTNTNFFNLSQIKNHQFEHLKLINSFKGYSFLLLHFYQFDKTFLIDFGYVEDLKSKKLNKVSLDLLQKEKDLVFELSLTFPGILNLKEAISNFIK